MTRAELLRWLREEREDRLIRLRRRARSVRRAVHGNQIHLRGLVEFSNQCGRRCAYCVLRGPNRRVRRYRMSTDEILSCADQACRLGYGTLVLQSGEAEPNGDPALCALLETLRRRHPHLSLVLSVGEAGAERYEQWRQAGASRYLLKFETSDPRLFARFHPPRRAGSPDRITLLRTLARLGYEVGGGIIVGLPGQTWASVARDLLLCRELDLDMIACGPYIPHPDTPLGRSFLRGGPASRDQVPNTVAASCRIIALARILCPEANIPAVTGLAAAAGDGLRRGLVAGANVVMVNLTPVQYQRAYALYPDQEVRDCLETHPALVDLLHRLGLGPASGPGGRVRVSVR